MKEAATKYVFTVCTPSYNRAHLLPEVYESLRAQTFRDFEWVVVDDGSTDGTKALVEGWIADNELPITYAWKPNGGFHTGINMGVRVAKGRFFLVLDSDDMLVPEGLARLLALWEAIPDEQKPAFAGVMGNYVNECGEIVGHPFSQDLIDSDTMEITYKYRVKGDKCGFYQTEVLRKYPHPEFEGEKFMPVSLAWKRLAYEYHVRFANEAIGIKRYFDDGTSANRALKRMRSPKGTLLYFSELISYPLRAPLSLAIKNHANYVRFSLHNRVTLPELLRHVRSWGPFVASLPIGIYMYSQDRNLAKRSTKRTA